MGMRSRTTTVGTGRFACPREGVDRGYRHQKARRWFTLFFIPVIPLGTQGEWVACDSCAATYDVDVLRAARW